MRRSLLTALLAVAFSTSSFAVLAPPAEAIVGGQVASEDYPFMTAFLEDGDQICGASLIAPQWVLSAAHCVFFEDDASHYSFRVGGAPDLNEEGGEVIQADQVIEHPLYDEEGTHDVSLFHLERPSVYQPITLANPDTQRHLWEPGDEARVIGYGGQVFQMPSIDGQLREVDVPVVSDEDCETTVFQGIDEATEVCAGNLEGTEDSCQGDSGGPLFVRDEQDRPVQMGVVSWGNGCAFPTQYGIYSRVGDRTLYDWIHNTINNTEPPPPPPPPPTSTTTVKVEPQGYIAASLPAFGLTGVTEAEFMMTCTTDLVTQGVDGYAWALPPELAVDGAVAKLTGDSFLHDLDITFWDSECGFLDGSSTGEPDEEMAVPAGTAFVLAHNFFGADALVDLTVTIPQTETVTATTLELRAPQPGGPRNDVAASLRDATSGAGIEGRTIEFFANCESIGAATTTADGSTSITVPPRYRAATTEFSALFSGEGNYAGSRAGADC